VDVPTHLGDLASIAGIGISIVGFIATLWNVARSRKAAEQIELSITGEGKPLQPGQLNIEASG
jgi:hypothetical protein